MQHMKNPEDLDLFDVGQMDITRVMEKSTHDSAKATMAVITLAGESGIIALHELSRVAPLAVFQRAAYEATLMSKRDPDDLKMEHISKTLWIWVQFLQGIAEHVKTMRADPRSLEELRRVNELYKFGVEDEIEKLQMEQEGRDQA